MCSAPINNEIYHTLGDRWYHAKDDPVALLRQEGAVKNPWTLERLRAYGLTTGRVLDIGCGAGFLSNYLQREGFHVSGIDIAADALRVAAEHDTTGKVDYRSCDAYQLPYADGEFDAVTCMDFLEHVERPEAIVAEVNRVLKPGGIFIFHTFNRNLLAKILVIKAVERFVKNTPKDMHVYHLFIKPREMAAHCAKYGIVCREWAGIRPIVLQKALWKGLFTGEVSNEFRFVMTRSLLISYLGVGQKTK